MQENVEALFLASDPFREGASLRLHTEVRGVERAIRRGRARDRVKLVPCFAPRTRDLQEALLLHDPRIVHFAGPGDGRGVIYLADAYGRRGVVEKEALAKLFGILSEWIKVVILNGYPTLPVVEALSDVVDYAIGMDQPLSDASAIVFAEAFYGALGMGKTVQASFELAASRLESEAHAASAIPVLRIRTGVDPTVPLVALAGSPASPETARRWSRPAAR
ncbi:MAG TPA: hypothetical protein VF584_23940 [Longimicrobium sp.]|jgi:hypothetical protein